MSENTQLDRIEQTAEVVAAYVSRNPIAASSLPDFIKTVHLAIVGLGQSLSSQAEVVSTGPAVSIKKSVTPDAITCLDCGKKFKSLKRHLMTSHETTPDRYKEKWGLASEYPIVAANYAAQRSALAKSIGLGRKR